MSSREAIKRYLEDIVSECYWYFDFDKVTVSHFVVFLVYKERIIMEYEQTSGILVLFSDEVWKVFYNRFKLNNTDLQNLMPVVIKEKLSIEVEAYSVLSSSFAV
jgi:hypothetical protein